MGTATAKPCLLEKRPAHFGGLAGKSKGEMNGNFIVGAIMGAFAVFLIWCGCERREFLAHCDELHGRAQDECYEAFYQPE